MLAEAEGFPNPNSGSRFNFIGGLMPVQLSEKTMMDEDKASFRGTMLLVDDDEIVLEACSWMLARRGFDVLKARNGKEAVEVFKGFQDKIDLVILDIQMPVMDGEQTYACLSRMDPAVNVLLISGYSETGRIKRMLQKGCRGFLQKPFNIKALIENIEAIQRENNA